MANILVVDDRPINREFLVTLLGYMKHDVLQAADGAEALQLASSSPPDLVITDVLMPVMDGVEFVRRLRAEPAIAHIPVIFYTATYRLGDVAQMAKACGVTTVIGKPSSPQAIMDAVSATLGGPATDQLPPADGLPGLPGDKAPARASGLPQLQRHLQELHQHLSLSAATALSLRLAAVLELGLELAAERDRDRLLESFVNAAREIMNAQYTAAGLADRGGTIKHLATRGLPASVRPLLIAENAENPLRQVLHHGEIQRRADSLPAGHPPVRSLLVLPVRSSTRTYGWLYFADKLGTDSFSDEDEQLATVLTTNLSLACENLCLFDEVHSHARDLESEVATRRASEHRLQVAQQVARIGTFEWDIGDNRIQVSDELAALYGVPPGQRFPENYEAWAAGIHPEDLTDFERLVRDSLASGQRFEAEWRVIWPDGSVHWLAGRAEIFRTESGLPKKVVGANIDITESKESEELIRRMAQHDALTGLPNRSLLYEFANRLLPAMRRRQANAAFLFIDLDRFKPINDIYGHDIGDAVLKEVAARLSGCLRSEDLVGRLGGDEFVAVLANVRGEEDAARIAFHLLRCLDHPYLADGVELLVSPSIGISLFPQDGGTVDELIKRADTAMYAAKQGGRNRFQFFQSELNIRSEEALRIEKRLPKALEFGEFELYLQPVISLENGATVGAEALVRWPTMGVSPDRFIPVAEMAGFMQSLGGWILQEACRLRSLWRDRGLPGFPVAVNVSPIQFRQRDFPKILFRAMESAGLQGGDLKLEITESMLIHNLDEAVSMLRSIREMGIAVALDDFGTGYSSLSYLARLPIDIVKLDQSFVRNLGQDRVSAVVAESIMALAKSLDLDVIAEGIESETALTFLKDHHCRNGQGFLFSQPLPANEFESWCMRRAA